MARAWRDEELVPLSALQHFSYCPRQCALIHVERTFDENLYTVRGRLFHERVDSGRPDARRGVRTERALPLWSDRWGLVGKSDAVEFDGAGNALPVEYKAGRRRESLHDRIQLCAQALCLEEMLDRPVPQGALFYQGARRREPVELDAGLRALTLETVEAVRALLLAERLPAAPHDRRCRRCSLRDSCLPAAVASPGRVAHACARLFDPLPAPP